MSLRPRVPSAQYRGHVLVTGPSVEPVTAAELRAFLVESEPSLPDGEADALIKEARNLIEEMTGIAFLRQDWRLALDHWPSGRGQWWDGAREGAISDLHGQPATLPMPRYPLISVQSVTVYDGNGASAVVDLGATFDVDVYQKPGRLALKLGATWPIALRPTNAIEIVYRAGFGDTAGTVPPVLARAVKQVAAYLYAHKGDDCDMGDALAAAGSLLDAYKVTRL
jgi:hypothetical protein